MRIEQRHFDAFVTHLRSALQEIGAGDQVATEIMAQVTPLSGIIVNTPS
jgi:truncated hemoglobin YjbI